MLFAGTDNMVWSGSEKRNRQMVQGEKVFVEITEKEIEEIGIEITQTMIVSD